LKDSRNAWAPRFSPDGKRLALLRQHPVEVGRGRWIPYELYVVDLDAKGPPAPLLTGLRCPSFAWSRDGRSLFVSSIPKGKRLEAEPAGNTAPGPTRLLDLTTGKDRALDIPEGHGVGDVAPDGKTVLTTVTTWDPYVERIVNAVVRLDARKATPLNEEGLNDP